MSVKRAAKISEHELETLGSIIAQHPIVENKLKTNEIEKKKAIAWENIEKAFNSREDVHKRDIKQLKGRLHCRIPVDCFLYQITHVD